MLVKLLIDKMKTTDALFNADRCILAGLLRRNLTVGNTGMFRYRSGAVFGN